MEGGEARVRIEIRLRPCSPLPSLVPPLPSMDSANNFILHRAVLRVLRVSIQRLQLYIVPGVADTPLIGNALVRPLRADTNYTYKVLWIVTQTRNTTPATYYLPCHPVEINDHDTTGLAVETGPSCLFLSCRPPLALSPVLIWQRPL